MDPVTIASGLVAATGLGLAWHMYRRASRAEAEAASLRGALRRSGFYRAAGPAGSRSGWSTDADRGGWSPLPNQRPWRMAPAGPVARRAPRPP